MIEMEGVATLRARRDDMPRRPCGGSAVEGHDGEREKPRASFSTASVFGQTG